MLESEQNRHSRKNAERVKGLMKGLSTLDQANQDLVLNALAAEMDIRRSKVDKLFSKYTTETTNDHEG